MDNLNLVLLSGGYYRCTPEWNEDPMGKHTCYKLYFPIEGDARILVDGVWYVLTSGNAYFINGFLLDEQRCDSYMKVYWLHFVPESQFLSMYLNGLKPVYCWEQSSGLLEIDFKRIPLLFDNPDKRDNTLREMTSLSLTCYMNSMILRLLSDMTEKQSMDWGRMSYDLYFKLEPAVDFINGNYHRNLKLSEIAQKSFLNPVYFLRLFKRCFQMTPNRYIIMKRLNEACRLLMKTEMSIQEISERTGFCNQFYFSKVFKSHFRKTPMEYRNTKLSP